MPELPEVETIKNGLNKLLIDRAVASVLTDNPKSFPNSSNDIDRYLIGSRVIGVRRRAKVLMIDLSSGYSLLTHLKMTGQLVFSSKDAHFGAGHPSSSLIGDLPDKTTRVTLGFIDGSSLYFNDQRKFGWMKLMPTNQIDKLDFFIKVGPEPLDGGFTWEILKERLLKRSKTAVKPALIDQYVVAGVGNIYADESLWGARINPARTVSELKDIDFKNLYKSLVDVLSLSIDKGGSTDRNYVDAEGNRGNYLQFANVFRREGQPCPRCHRAIVKIRLSGRGTHFCPHCQPM